MWKLLVFAACCVTALSQSTHVGHSLVVPFDSQDSRKYWKLSPFSSVEAQAVKLTPTHATGFAWNLVRSLLVGWEVDLDFRVSNKVADVADRTLEGLAFWYSARPGILGPVFGSADFWSGLGLFFTETQSTIDASDQKYITVSAVVNDGTQQYHGSFAGLDRDGKPKDGSLPSEMIVGSCLRRYTSGQTLEVNVRYERNQLTVRVGGAECFEARAVVLGVDKFFGVSAHGARRHDVHRFQTRMLGTQQASQQAIRAAREGYGQALREQHALPSHKVDKEEFQLEALNIVRQIQDTQSLMEEELEAMMDTLDFTMHTVLNQTEDLQALHFHVLELKAQRTRPGAGAQGTDKLEQAFDEAVNDIRRHLDLRLSQEATRAGGKGGLAGLAWLLGGLALIASLAFAGYAAHRAYKKRQEVYYSKRFV